MNDVQEKIKGFINQCGKERSILMAVAEARADELQNFERMLGEILVLIDVKENMTDLKKFLQLNKFGVAVNDKNNKPGVINFGESEKGD